MNYTQHYQLPTWDEDDRILRTDFNDMTDKLDTALAAHDGKLDWLGNCRVETGSYVGTGECGEEHPNTLTLQGEPLVVLVYGGGFPAILTPVGQSIHFRPSAADILPTTVAGHTISWYHGTNVSSQMNAAIPYYYLAISQAV